jgi:hypothetical protein
MRLFIFSVTLIGCVWLEYFSIGEAVNTFFIFGLLEGVSHSHALKVAMFREIDEMRADIRRIQNRISNLDED